MWYRNSKICSFEIGNNQKKVKEYKERDEKKREEFREAIKDIPKENLVYVDKSGVNQYSYLEYGRAPRGKKISAKVSGRKFERTSVVAAKYGKNVLAPMGYTGTCDAIFSTNGCKICLFLN